MAKPSISVIISAKNEAAYIESCLKSLLAQKTRKNFEIILVDNNSSDNTYRLAQKIAKEDPRVRVFREKKAGMGCPYGRNRGAKESHAEVLLFTDADCTFTPDWVEKMAAPLLDWKKQRVPLGAVGGQTLSELPKGRKMALAERYADVLFHEWEKDSFSEFPGFLPWAPTCNLGVRRELFEALGCFDDNLVAGYDPDFCWRLVMSGFTIAYIPDAVLFHKRRTSVKKFLGQMNTYSFYNSKLLAHYEKLFAYNPFLTRKERLENLVLRAKKSIEQTKTWEDLRHRGLDILVQAQAAKAALRASYKKIKIEKKLDRSRLGKSTAATDLLPKSYLSLQKKGWCYWKSPADISSDGELILFHPKKKEWLRLNETAWRVWEVKSNGGDSEAAVRALGQEDDNEEALSDIDALSWNLHQMGLLR